MSRHLFRSIGAALLIAVVITALAPVRPAYAAIVTVTNLNDSGAGSLRQAIADAAAGDVINFSSALSGGTIHLASTLTLSKNVTITGVSLASPITISGDTNNDGFGDVRVFSVNSGVMANLLNFDITLGAAAEGGAIVNNGTLTIFNSTLSFNSATSFGGGAINNNGSLAVQDSSFSYNSAVASGGAISNFGGGSLMVWNSTFYGNSAQEGGAIGNSRPLTIWNSTFVNNSATAFGGGGINNSNSLIITNSTFSHNSAVTSGGGISNYGGGTLNYTNTIIANSTGGDCFNNSTIGTNTSNLVEDGSCSASLSGDPNLRGIASNGGRTSTMALAPGSPALDAGNDAACSGSPVNGLDQRGVARPQGAHCDIGAYEAAASLVVTNTNDSGAGSLRTALATAAGSDTITFDASLSGATIRLASSLTVDRNLTLDGSALASSIVLSGDTDNNGTGNVRVLAVLDSNVSLVLDTLTITKGLSPNHGGAIYNFGNLTVMNSTFSGNSVSLSGGAIYNGPSGILTIANSTLHGNTAGFGGGGIFNGGMVNIMNSTLSNNSAPNGGGIYNSGGDLSYSNTIIANSTSGGDCAGIGTINFPTSNLVEDGSCSATLSGDPNLGALADNGGPTQTMALLTGSPAIDAGNDLVCANWIVNSLDQRGEARPQGAHCDIGAYERDTIPPVVQSITRAEASPTSAAHVDFTVTFSEPVTGVDLADFTLATTGGVSNPTLSGLSGAGSSYTVTVATGSGNGTIRLDVPATAVVTDLAGNPLDGLPFAVGLAYTIDKDLVFTSASTTDGWVLESAETSNKGGTLNKTATTFRLGDDAARKQYRGILSFNTSSLPDNAVITRVTLKLKKQGVTGGGNPVTLFQGFMADIKKGIFGASGLQAGDFQAAANKSVGPFKPALSGGWYNLNLTGAKAFVNKLATSGGLTQIRLRFKLDDNNNAVANFLSLYSGNSPAASRPKLIIEYYVP
ncbi:MAG: choice-of-anchor Q domain-containing protein [Chloroflexota bacterium]